MAAEDGFVETVDRAAEEGRTPFYERARERNLAPLWRVLGGLVTEEPRSPAVPAHWAYSDVRPYLIEACDLISTEEAERRVLVFENPGLPGQSRITPSLFAGYQIIRPGEVAPAHRHVASALRFILEGKDAYTAVAGERTMMEPGDFVITPSWTWHDHGNESDELMVWIDGLDMHMVNLVSASFREGYPGRSHPVTRPEGAAMAEVGFNLVPVDFETTSQTSPIFNYPYRRTREALEMVSRTRAPDACHAFKMHYINPLNGKSAIPTITTAMQLLPKGFRSSSYKSTAGTVFSVVEGKGSVTVGDMRFQLAPKDLFVAPSWFPIQFEAESDLILFSYSDRIVQDKLDLFRESRGDA
jgi:gentisate 1,2-dioxygenase